MSLLAGRRGLVLGVANDKSLAWAIARAAAAQGATVGISYAGERMERRARPLGESIGAPLILPCDVTDADQIDALFEAADVALGGLEFVVHGVAYALRDDLTGRFVDTSRAGFAAAMDVSTYSLLALARRAATRLSPGGAILTLSYYGAEKVIGPYGVMGPAKAALEACVRYLAAELGPAGVRVNAISAGAIKTLSAAGIPGLRDMLHHAAERAPLRRNVTADDVAGAAVFLLSDLAAGVTGEILHVDAGYHVIGL